ncbi:MAG: methyltransferase [Pontiella sp.]
MTAHAERSGFTFKQFHVAHEGCAMKVGTDAVLLGAWAPIAGISRVLDIGTGSGILSLMLAQRTAAPFHIDALDINADAVGQAIENVIHSPWANHIRCLHGALQDHTAEPYDLLISNPPFYPPGQILSSPARQHARHTEQLSHGQLLLDTARLSLCNSALALVLPYDAAQTIIQDAPASGWVLTDCCTVSPKSGKKPNRQLLLFRRTEPESITRTELILRNNNGSRSPAFTQLAEAFYLKD